ncbi:MAG TPA: PadR family transcriptional regulator [Streptomyces sp.]
MSVKHSLLAVLADGDRYGYQLRAEFEERTGATWPLNIGQVYTTLNRLERDGLVEPAGQDSANHVFYRITDAGRDELFAWFARPVSRAERPRDELAVKLALAVTVAGVDVAAIVHAQRKHALAALQDFTRVKARLAADELAASLVLESMIFQSEAEIRWLDHVEARVLRHARETRSEPAAGRGSSGSSDNSSSRSSSKSSDSSTERAVGPESSGPVAATREGKTR